jgi:hypothetical protein
MDIMHTLTEIKVLQDELKAAIAGYTVSVLTNKSISLEERWEAYLCVEDHLPTESYGDGYIEKLGWDCAYDDLHLEKYQTREFSAIWSMIQECRSDMGDPEYYKKYLELTEEQLDEWREAVLASGFGRFIYDW